MKQLTRIFCSLLLATCASAAHAATSVTTVVSANIVETIAVISRTPLDFGFITPSMTSGTVTVSPDNQRSTTGNVELNDSEFARAIFVIRGTPNRSYSIQTPGTVTFTAEGAEAQAGQVRDLTVRNFVTRSKNTGQTGSNGKLGSTGEDQVYLGGTLVVPANAVPGRYRGLVTITVSY